MPKKQFAGQLNMFDFFQNENYNEDGSLMEGEMVSLIPDDFSSEQSEITDKHPGKEHPGKEHPGEEHPGKEYPEKEHPEKEHLEKEHLEKKHPEDMKDFVMGHRFKDASGKLYQVAYINYKEVLLEEGKDSDGVHSFETTQEAVSFYVDQLNRLQELNLKEISYEK